jgi:protein dithiol oxidoreductase (disulfide-forming)
MPLSRRDVLRLAAAGFAATAPGWAAAQEGQRTLEERFRAITPQPGASDDKIEVIDFFWYGCPYCFQLLPMLTAWEKTKPADVVVRRIPAILRQEWVPDAHLYYTLDTLGEADRLHTRVFDAIHRDRLISTDTESWAKWAVANGIDRAKWDAAYTAKVVRDKVVRAVELGREYDVRSTPAMVVDGRYQTNSRLSGTLQQMMPTVDELIQLARERRKKPATA